MQAYRMITSNFIVFGQKVFTARNNASAVYAMGLCLSVCLSQVGVLPKTAKLSIKETTPQIAQGI